MVIDLTREQADEFNTRMRAKLTSMAEQGYIRLDEPIPEGTKFAENIDTIRVV